MSPVAVPQAGPWGSSHHRDGSGEEVEVAACESQRIGIAIIKHIQHPHSLSLWPANRPSSAIDLTDLPPTPPMRSLGIQGSPDADLWAGGSREVLEGGSSGCEDRAVNGDHRLNGHGDDVKMVDGGEEGESEGELAVLMRTIDFAARKHSCQRRKDVDQTPYINHPIAVANFLTSTGITDVRTIQAAILHDTVEDTHTTIGEIAEYFGRDVARIVHECSDDPSLSGQQRKAEQVRSARYKSRAAQQVKLADKLHNLESIRRSPPVGWGVRRIQAYFIWAKQVTDVCANAHPMLARRLSELYETAYTRVNGEYHPCHPDVRGPLTEEEKSLVDGRLQDLEAGERLSPKPIFF